MEPEQYEIMERVEGQHWWYLGLRDLLERSWRRNDLALPPRPAVLDAGCGTGGNLEFFSAHLKPEYLAGFDNSALALDSAKRKCPSAEIYASDICAPHVHRDQLDLVFCCDVIYVPGLEASKAGLASLVEHLKPGAQFILHLPAYNWLKSAHDRAVHTRERYTLKQARQLMSDLQLDCQLGSYRLCPLLPLILLKRLPSLLQPQKNRESKDLDVPSAWLNRWLLRWVQAENRLIASGTSMPWGSSIITFARRRMTESQASTRHV